MLVKALNLYIYIYIFFFLQFWECLLHKDGDLWPQTRGYHIAVCLGYGRQYKKVLFSGGWNGYEAISDTWLLDPQSGKWEKVRMEI